MSLSRTGFYLSLAQTLWPVSFKQVDELSTELSNLCVLQCHVDGFFPLAILPLATPPLAHCCTICSSYLGTEE